MKYLLLVLLIGCGEVHGMPFGGELPESGGAAGGAPQGTGGMLVSTTPGGSGGVVGTGGVGGAPAPTGVEAWPVCPDYVTEFGSPISVSPACGVSADGHLLYGCVGVERQGYPFDTTPCQFTDPNDQYNDSHVFGCVDMRNCS